MKKTTIAYVITIFSLFLLSACVKTTDSTNVAQPGAIAMPQDEASVEHIFSLPPAGDDIVGAIVPIQANRGDTLSSLAQKYELGYEALAAANPRYASNGRIPSGATVILPNMYILPPEQYRRGIVINIPELRLYYFNGSDVMIFPVALGREGWRTPIAKTFVYKKEASPTWHVPESIRQYYFEKYGQEHPTEVGPGPENPLGNYAIYLQMTGYLIHGTNAPSSIGHFVSSGCIRMYNQNVEALFNEVSKGTPVNIIYYTSLVGWQDNQLYMQSYPEISHEDGLYDVQDVFPAAAVRAAMGSKSAVTVDWNKVQQVIRNHTGIPTMIGVNS